MLQQRSDVVEGVLQTALAKVIGMPRQALLVTSPCVPEMCSELWDRDVATAVVGDD